jgi:hypothetical protein
MPEMSADLFGDKALTYLVTNESYSNRRGTDGLSRRGVRQTLPAGRMLARNSLRMRRNFKRAICASRDYP